jgi:hypothetical protein
MKLKRKRIGQMNLSSNSLIFKSETVKIKVLNKIVELSLEEYEKYCKDFSILK